MCMDKVICQKDYTLPNINIVYTVCVTITSCIPKGKRQLSVSFVDLLRHPRALWELNAAEHTECMYNPGLAGIYNRKLRSAYLRFSLRNIIPF